MSDSPELNSTISHYRIVSKLGAGGMGVVYLAQDISELGRNVALKILAAEVAKDKDRLKRFTQEARTVSNLNHPNILTVYEFGQSDSSCYMATEYVDGVTLRQHLSNRRLKLVDVLDVAIQIVAALNAAHEAGVTHRDLKPENVMVRKDHIVKVLDFGLAKLSTAVEGASHGEAETRLRVETEPGLVMGTVSYMSPEQSAGKPIDPRTDIWSLGVVLYEMIAGCVPFQGKDIHRQIIAIQESDPAPLSTYVKDVPERLEEIVVKCLAKEKDERYQTAKDLLIDLRNLRRKLDVGAEIERTVAPTSRSTSPGGMTINARPVTVDQPRQTSSAENVVTGIKQHKLATAIVLVLLLALAAGLVLYGRIRKSDGAISSIAVLPFINQSNNADVDYLSDGMTESLITALSQIPNLNVKARSSVFRYKGKETDPKTVGKELGVQAVLNGRVVQRGDQLNLNLELVDVQTENVLWSEQYSRQQADLVSLQSDIARDVSSKLKMKLSGDQEHKIAKTNTENSEAYKLYLQGRFFANKRTPKDSQKAIQCFEQAVSIDRNYAQAYFGLAIGYSYLAIYGYSPAKEVFPKAREYAARSIELDKNFADPHIILGLLIFLQDHDLAGWERETKLALELNPKSTDAHRLTGLRLMFLGKFDEALAALQRALDIEPLSLPGNVNYSYALFYAGRIDESEAQLKKTIELSPDFWMSHYYLFNTYRLKGNYQAAAEELGKAKQYRAEDEAAQIVKESFSKGGWQGLLHTLITDPRLKMSAYDLASFQAEVGNKDQAFAMLNKSFEDSEQSMGFTKVDPFFKSLHNDPRFPELLKKIGLPVD